MNRTPFLLCCDGSMKVGLHVTVYSLLRHMEKGVRPEIHVLHEGFSEEDVRLLRQTADKCDRPYEMIVSRFEPPEALRGLPALRGSYLTYARLFAHEGLDADRLIYLDSDLLIKRDLSGLQSVDLEGNMLGGRVNGRADGFIDREFLCGIIGLDPSTPTFNAGVLVIDVKRWKARCTAESVIGILRDHGPYLKAHDQSVLNALACGAFFPLDPSYNVQADMPRSRTSSDLEGKVWHFMGAPKPWDSMAFLVNGYAKEFFRYLDMTALAGWRPTLRLREAARSGRNYRYFARHLVNLMARRSSVAPSKN